MAIVGALTGACTNKGHGGGTAAGEQAEPDDPLEAVLAKTRALVGATKFDEALALLDKEIAASKDEALAARLHARRASIRAGLGELDDALVEAKAALETLQRLEAPDMYLADGHLGMGNVFWRRREVMPARSHWQRAYDLRPGPGKAARGHRGRVGYNLASAMSVDGEVDAAIKLALDSIADERAGGAPECPDLAASRASAAFIVMQSGDMELSEKLGLEAIADCEGVAGMELALASFHGSLGHAYVGTGNPAQARTHFARARELLDAHGGTPDQRAAVYVSEAMLEVDAKDFDAALTRIAQGEAALAGAKAGPQSPWPVQLCTERVRVLHKAQRNDEARPALAQCLAKADALGVSKASRRMWNLDWMAEQLGVEAAATP